MPPKGRGRGGRNSVVTNQIQVPKGKTLLEVRESSNAPLFQGINTPQGLKKLEDRIIFFKELLSPKLANVSLNLDTGYTLIDWIESRESQYKGVLTVQTKSGNSIVKHAYQKRIALMDPYRWMKYNERPSDPFFWQFSGYGDISSPENQGYIDVVGSYLASRLRGTLGTPHFCEFYGAFRAVADCFLYNLEDDLEDFRFTKWFWDAIDAKKFGLRVVEKGSGRQLSREEIQELLRPDADLLTNTSDSDSDSDSGSDSDSDSDGNSLGAESLPGIRSESTQDKHSNFHAVELEDTSSIPSEAANENILIRKGPGSIHTVRTMTTASDDDSFAEDYSVHAELYEMPVAVMFLEHMEGAMDDLLEERLYTPLKTEEQKAQWTAWLFQICAALSQLQGALRLTHNDLHTNNVLWKPTEQEYIWYKGQNGLVWKVPTFGRIFTIIDYGRAIFTMNNFTCVSSDYDDGHDAAGMYNFGPLLDKSMPKVTPNRSFDLCRLACSLLRAFYPQIPPEKVKGKVLSKEGSWEVKETVEPLFNLVWSWLIDSSGVNVLEEEDGEEKYPGFDLYQVIAATVNSAVPEDQLKKGVFTPFQWKGVVPLEIQYSTLL